MQLCRDDMHMHVKRSQTEQDVSSSSLYFFSIDSPR